MVAVIVDECRGTFLSNVYCHSIQWVGFYLVWRQVEKVYLRFVSVCGRFSGLTCVGFG